MQFCNFTNIVPNLHKLTTHISMIYEENHQNTQIKHFLRISILVCPPRLPCVKACYLWASCNIKRRFLSSIFLWLRSQVILHYLAVFLILYFSVASTNFQSSLGLYCFQASPVVGYFSPPKTSLQLCSGGKGPIMHENIALMNSHMQL